MEKETINLKLPLIKVNIGDPWRATDFVKEHFPTGCFIVDDGIQYYLASNDGSGYICDICIARELVQEAIIEEVRHDDLKENISILASLNNRLEQIAMLAEESKMRAISIEDRLDDLGKHGSGDGVNILDVAKSFAVIQRPDLIEKL